MSFDNRRVCALLRNRAALSNSQFIGHMIAELSNIRNHLVECMGFRIVRVDATSFNVVGGDTVYCGHMQDEVSGAYVHDSIACASVFPWGDTPGGFIVSRTGDVWYSSVKQLVDMFVQCLKKGWSFNDIVAELEATKNRMMAASRALLNNGPGNGKYGVCAILGNFRVKSGYVLYYKGSRARLHESIDEAALVRTSLGTYSLRVVQGTREYHASGVDESTAGVFRSMLMEDGTFNRIVQYFRNFRGKQWLVEDTAGELVEAMKVPNIQIVPPEAKPFFHNGVGFVEVDYAELEKKVVASFQKAQDEEAWLRLAATYLPKMKWFDGRPVATMSILQHPATKIVSVDVETYNNLAPRVIGTYTVEVPREEPITLNVDLRQPVTVKAGPGSTVTITAKPADPVTISEFPKPRCPFSSECFLDAFVAPRFGIAVCPRRSGKTEMLRNFMERKYAQRMVDAFAKEYPNYTDWVGEVYSLDGELRRTLEDKRKEIAQAYGGCVTGRLKCSSANFLRQSEEAVQELKKAADVYSARAASMARKAWYGTRNQETKVLPVKVDILNRGLFHENLTQFNGMPLNFFKEVKSFVVRTDSEDKSPHVRYAVRIDLGVQVFAYCGVPYKKLMSILERMRSAQGYFRMGWLDDELHQYRDYTESCPVSGRPVSAPVDMQTYATEYPGEFVQPWPKDPAAPVTTEINADGNVCGTKESATEPFHPQASLKEHVIEVLKHPNAWIASSESVKGSDSMITTTVVLKTPYVS